jgi:hypothetical protein
MQHYQNLLQQYNNDKHLHPQNEYILHHDNPLYVDYHLEINRTVMGHYCAYVSLPNNHPDVGREYDDIDIAVHGGLTFGDENKFGIDFAHLHDFVPHQGAMHPELFVDNHHIVWMFDMVKAEGFRMIELFYGRAQ